MFYLCTNGIERSWKIAHGEFYQTPFKYMYILYHYMQKHFQIKYRFHHYLYFIIISYFIITYIIGDMHFMIRRGSRGIPRDPLFHEIGTFSIFHHCLSYQLLHPIHFLNLIWPLCYWYLMIILYGLYAFQYMYRYIITCKIIFNRTYLILHSTHFLNPSKSIFKNLNISAGLCRNILSAVDWAIVDSLTVVRRNMFYHK